MARKTAAAVLDQPVTITLVQLAEKLGIATVDLKELIATTFQTTLGDTDTVPSNIAEFLNGNPNLLELTPALPSAAPVVTGDFLAQELGIEFSDIQNLIEQHYGFFVESSTEEIPDEIAVTVRNLAKDLENTFPKDDQEAGRLTLKDAQTIAAANKTSLTTVKSLYEVLRQRREQLIIAQGYNDQAREVALSNFGRSLYMQQYFEDESEKLDELEQEINSQELNVESLCQSLGIDIGKITTLQQQKMGDRQKQKQERVEAVEKLTPDELANLELKPEIMGFDSLKLMAFKVNELGKKLGI